MKFEEIIRLTEPKPSVKAEIKEVVRDVAEQSHVFIRVRLSGWHFPERALEPFVVIGKVVSRFVRIGPDQTTADAYFDVDLPAADRLSFGYGKVISWDFEVAVDPKQIGRLDRARLPAGHIGLKAAQ
jgi:hypothetical protein